MKATDAITQARLMAAEAGIPSIRVAIAEIMADGRERTASDIARDAKLTLPAVKQNTRVMLEMGLLRCDGSKGVAIYRDARAVVTLPAEPWGERA